MFTLFFNFIAYKTLPLPKTVMASFVLKRKCIIGFLLSYSMIIFLSVLLMLDMPSNCMDCTETNLDELQLDETRSSFPPFDIDVVVSWAGPSTADDHDQRSRDNGELRYCLRSIYQHIPWFHRLYLLVNPSIKHLILGDGTFLNQSAISDPLHRVKVIGIDEIFRNKSNAVDQHNSEAIESNIHRISGLSSFYIYFNDDYFIGRPLSWRFFFEHQYDGQNRRRLIPRIPYHIFKTYQHRPAFAPLPCLESNVDDEDDGHWSMLKREDIPYRNEECMIQWVEHLPRAYYKSDWIEFEEEFPKYFLFIESLKRRKLNCQGLIVSLNQIWIHRWLRGDIEMNKMYIRNYDVWFSLIGRIGNGDLGLWGIKTTIYHHWIWGIFGTKYLCALNFNLKRISRTRPLTFNINDDYPESDYHHHQRLFTKAMDEYFSVKSPLEK